MQTFLIGIFVTVLYLMNVLRSFGNFITGCFRGRDRAKPSSGRSTRHSWKERDELAVWFDEKLNTCIETELQSLIDDHNGLNALQFLKQLTIEYYLELNKIFDNILCFTSDQNTVFKQRMNKAKRPFWSKWLETLTNIDKEGSLHRIGQKAFKAVEEQVQFENDEIVLLEMQLANRAVKNLIEFYKLATKEYLGRHSEKITLQQFSEYHDGLQAHLTFLLGTLMDYGQKMNGVVAESWDNLIKIIGETKQTLVTFHFPQPKVNPCKEVVESLSARIDKYITFMTLFSDGCLSWYTIWARHKTEIKHVAQDLQGPIGLELEHILSLWVYNKLKAKIGPKLVHKNIIKEVLCVTCEGSNVYCSLLETASHKFERKALGIFDLDKLLCAKGKAGENRSKQIFKKLLEKTELSQDNQSCRFIFVLPNQTCFEQRLWFREICAKQDYLNASFINETSMLAYAILNETAHDNIKLACVVWVHADKVQVELFRKVKSTQKIQLIGITIGNLNLSEINQVAEPQIVQELLDRVQAQLKKQYRAAQKIYIVVNERKDICDSLSSMISRTNGFFACKLTKDILTEKAITLLMTNNFQEHIQDFIAVPAAYYTERNNDDILDILESTPVDTCEIQRILELCEKVELQYEGKPKSLRAKLLKATVQSIREDVHEGCHNLKSLEEELEQLLRRYNIKA